MQTHSARQNQSDMLGKFLLGTTYKVFRLPRNINDEQDNYGNNSKFFVPKQKQRGG